MQPIFQMKVPKQFPSYIPENVEQIFVGVGGPEASGSVLADCQPIGSDSELCGIFRIDQVLRPMPPLYLSSFCWICSVMGVSLEWISNTNSNPIQIINLARAFNGTERARAVNITDWALAVNSAN